MSRANGILVQSHQGMRLITSDGKTVESLAIDLETSEDFAAAIVDSLQTASRGKWNLIIAPSAARTLATSLVTEDLGGVQRKITAANLGFVLEEHLPWSAEDFSARLTSIESEPLGLAIETNEWEPTLQRLRQKGHRVVAIVPAALLQHEGIAQQHPSQTTGSSCLFQNEEGVHWLKLEEGKIADWRFWPSDDGCPVDPALLAAEISFVAANDELSTIHVEPKIVAAISGAGLKTSALPLTNASWDELLWRGARSYWKRPNASLNLAVGRLAESSPVDSVVATSRSLMAALMLLLLVTSAALGWKGYRLQTIVDDAQRQQGELYRKTFPETPVPLAVASRFDSQHRSIVGQRGGAEQVPFPHSVLSGLKCVLAAHQAPLRSRFEEIAITDELVEIECEFRNHEDASQMIERLEETGLKVEPPQLQKLDDKRIGTRLRGRLTDRSQEQS